MAVVTWYVVFKSEVENRFCLLPLLREGFKHCYLFRDIKPHVAVWDPTGFNINTSLKLDVEAKMYADYLKRVGGDVILRFRLDVSDIKHSWHIGNIFPTCVTIVKMMMGINTIAITPYQLYRHLLKVGAEVV